MIPIPPSGRPDPRTQALFRRNALGMGEVDSVQEPGDWVDLQAQAQGQTRTQPDPPHRHEAHGKSAEEIERERHKKSYRTPKYPTPAPPLPRRRVQGWILSSPVPEPKSRDMREDELAAYSRHHSHGEEDPQDEDQDEREIEEMTGLEGLLEDPPGSPDRERLAHRLMAFGWGILRLCQGQRLKVKLSDGLASRYLRECNRVEAARVDLLGNPRPLYFALAQAYDVALGRGKEASRDSLAVLTNFHQSESHNQPGASPARYFADSVAAFLCGESGSCMLAYVEYLILTSRSDQGGETQ